MRSFVSGVVFLIWRRVFPAAVGSRQSVRGVGPQMKWQVASQSPPGGSHCSPQLASTMPSPQVIRLPLHVPLVYLSLIVQTLPSLHGVLSGWSGLEHWPVLESQVPAWWHWSSGVRVTAVPPQAPPVQWSPVVQALPSLHGVPFGWVGLEQSPVLGSQVPAWWHWSSGVQVTGVPPQEPPVH